MENESPIEFNFGLSDEEVEDLTKLIKELKDEQTSPQKEGRIENSQEQIKLIHERLIRFSEMLLKMDATMKSFNELVRLFYKKSEITNSVLNKMVEYTHSIKDEQ